MQKRLVTFCTLSLILITSSVFAYSVTLTPPPSNSGSYIAVGGGFNYLQKQLFASDNNSSSSGTIKYNIGWNGMVNLGYHYNAWRYEFSATYMRNSIDNRSGGDDNGSTATTAYMGNVLYNFNQKGTWIPYVGAGLGLVTIYPPSDLDNKNAFGYQGILGLSVKVSRHVELFGEYRHLGTSAFSTGNSIDTRYLNNLFDGGIRIYF